MSVVICKYLLTYIGSKSVFTLFNSILFAVKKQPVYNRLWYEVESVFITLLVGKLIYSYHTSVHCFEHLLN